MYIPEIIEVKDHLTKLKEDSLIADWELPYENILTRRSAAIFFIEPNSDEENLDKVWSELAKYEDFSYRKNTEKKLSELKYRITFSKQEKEKNKQLTSYE